MDYEAAILADLDFVIGSIHAGRKQAREKMMMRLLKAMENPYVRLIGHPTNRIVGSREASDIDMAEVIRQAKDTGTWLELNAAWQRLDLKDIYLRQAKDSGVKIMINTDSHDIHSLESMQYGVFTARRGWLESKDVINTMSVEKLTKLLKSPKA